MKNTLTLTFLLLLALSGCQKPEGSVPEGDSDLYATTTAKPTDTLKAALNWVASLQGPAGLLESAEQTSFVSLYDNALAAILFIKTEKPDLARDIFDYYKNILEPEFADTGGGFYQFRNLSGADPSRVWLGDNAWLLLALRQYRQAYSDSRYNDMIIALDNWIRSMQEPDGGLRSGYNADGTPIVRVTEGMITAYQAVAGYDDFHQSLAAYLQAHRWDAEAEGFLAEAPTSRYAQALDLYSLAALIWPENASGFLSRARQFRTEQWHYMNKSMISGYCFDLDLDVVWLEGTAQIAVAQNEVEMGTTYRTTLKNLEASMLRGFQDSNTLGLPYSTNPGSSYGAVALWDHAHTKPCLSATAWYLFARLGVNPIQTTDPGKPSGSPML